MLFVTALSANSNSPDPESTPLDIHTRIITEYALVQHLLIFYCSVGLRG